MIALRCHNPSKMFSREVKDDAERSQRRLFGGAPPKMERDVFKSHP